MKRSALAIVILCLVMLVVLVPAAGSSGSPFLGNWKGTDVDGSDLTLWIGQDGWSGGRLLKVRGHDNQTGGWCGVQARFEALGVLETEYTLATSGAWWCLEPVENILYFLAGTLAYDAGTDTISDDSGVVFHRAPGLS